MQITIKKMETDDEIRGKAYVHWKSWQEAYSRIVKQAYLDERTIDNAPQLSGFKWPWGASAKYDSSAVTYNCANCLPSGANTVSTSGLNNPRFLRFNYYTSTYTYYQKIFQ